MLNRASPPSKIVLHGPGFDHALKDPCEEGVSIDSRTRVVIVEGLYLAMITPPWDEVSSLLDLLYFVDCDRRVATNRLVRRHVATGVEATVGAAERRARGSDRDNAVWILANRIKRVDRVVESREDKLWAEVGGRGEEEGSVEDGDMGRGMDDAARGEDRDGGKVVNKQAGSMPAVGVFSPPPVTAASPSAADAKNTRRESLQKVGEFKTPGLPASSSQNNGDMAHNNGDAAGQGQRSESEVSATTGTPSPKINQTKVMPSVGVFSPAKVMDSPKRKLSSDVEGGKVQDGPNGTNGKSNDMPTKRTKT